MELISRIPPVSFREIAWNRDGWPPALTYQSVQLILWKGPGNSIDLGHQFHGLLPGDEASMPARVHNSCHLVLLTPSYQPLAPCLDVHQLLQFDESRQLDELAFHQFQHDRS